MKESFEISVPHGYMGNILIIMWCSIREGDGKNDSELRSRDKRNIVEVKHSFD